MFTTLSVHRILLLLWHIIHVNFTSNSNLAVHTISSGISSVRIFMAHYSLCIRRSCVGCTILGLRMTACGVTAMLRWLYLHLQFIHLMVSSWRLTTDVMIVIVDYVCKFPDHLAAVL